MQWSSQKAGSTATLPAQVILTGARRTIEYIKFKRAEKRLEYINELCAKPRWFGYGTQWNEDRATKYADNLDMPIWDFWGWGDMGNAKRLQALATAALEVGGCHAMLNVTAEDWDTITRYK